VQGTVTTDRGTQFTSALWSSTCTSLGIKHVLTTAYQPPAEQRYGGACAQADQGCLMCTWFGSCVAFPPSVGAAGPTCCTQGGFCDIFSGAGDWDTTGSSSLVPHSAHPEHILEFVVL
jgi:transposase InsO family protein